MLSCVFFGPEVAVKNVKLGATGEPATASSTGDTREVADEF